MSIGPGDKNCKHCEGSGTIRETAPETVLKRGSHPPRFRRCECVLQRDIAANVERGMRKLMEAPKIEESPLIKAIVNDVWVTASKTWFTANLRHIAIRQPPTWYFKVISDADLMTAWLASIALKGKDILDPDAAKVSLTHITIVDLVMPPDLLVIRLGIKQARNVATPEVLLEALRHREHAGLPTWVWDTPREMLDVGHICWSSMVAEYMSTWRHVRTRDAIPTPTQKPDVLENPHAAWAENPSKEDSDPDAYEDQEPAVASKPEEISELKGAAGHIDLSLRPKGRPTLARSSGGRKTLWGNEGEGE
jgi:hypothetical protein